MTYTTTISELKTSVEPSLENRFQAALEHARRLTAMNELSNIEVVLAWETVDELCKAKAKQPKPTTATFAQYCAENPEAPECRIYED